MLTIDQARAISDPYSRSGGGDTFGSRSCDSWHRQAYARESHRHHHRHFPWLVGDLHERNIMRDANRTPTIIDALVGAISLTDRRELGWLDAACGEAQRFRESGTRPPRWDEAVEDAEL